MLNITGQNIELTQSIKQRIEERFKKVEKRFPINSANVCVSLTNKKIRCSIDVSSNDYGKVSAEDISEDFYTTANHAFEKLTRQLNDAKEKHKNKGGDTIRHDLLEVFEES